MRLVELYDIIENGESSTVEFKRKFTSPEKIAKEMIALSNTKGGVIIFGIDDDKSVVGVESEKGEIELIDMAANNNCDPPVTYFTEIIHIYRKDVVAVILPESNVKPHKLISGGDDDNKVYVRLNDKSVIASREMIKILKRSNPDSPPAIINIGEKEKFLIEYLKKNEKITVSELKLLLNISTRRASRILINLVRANILRHYPEMGNKAEDFFTLL